jgi:hypothetical protein
MDINTPNNPQPPTQDSTLLTVLTILFGTLGIVMLYLVIKIWPSGNNGLTERVQIFFVHYTLNPERRYLLLMTLGGALGASVHLLISFTTFVGNRAFVTSWIPWYLLRPIIGAGMALFFYLLLRGGVLTYTPSSQGNKTTPAAAATTVPVDSVALRTHIADSLNHLQPPPVSPEDSVKQIERVLLAALQKARTNVPPPNPPGDVPPLNPFGMMGIACMVGLFSKEASKKLEEVFKTLFNVQREVPDKDKLPTDTRAGAKAEGHQPAGEAATSTTADDINDVLPDADQNTNTGTAEGSSETAPQG